MKAVIFDLDGTLADSLSSIHYCANAALERVQLMTYEKESYKYFVGEGADVLLERCLLNQGIAKESRQFQDMFPKLQESYKEIFARYCMYEVCPYDGIEELLQTLKENNVQIAVLSNKPHERSVEVMDALFGKDYFDCIIGQSVEREKKPSPEGVFYISRQLGVSLQDIVYVGDTGTDMQTGKNAGVYTVGVLWGFRDEKELLEHGADQMIEKPSQLIEIIS